MPNNTYNAVMSLNPDGTGTPYGDTRGGSKYILTVREVSPTEAFHKAGSYIRYNGVAYRCKTDIQANTALVVGTNIEVPDLPDGTVLLTPEESIAMAAGIGYDNRASGLDATEVQSAIDEVNSKYTNEYATLNQVSTVYNVIKDSLLRGSIVSTAVGSGVAAVYLTKDATSTQIESLKSSGSDLMEEAVAYEGNAIPRYVSVFVPAGITIVFRNAGTYNLKLYE